LIKAQPEKSDRQIADTVKVDHKTVGAVRAEQEARGEIPHVETRTDSMGRQQPAKRGWTRERWARHRAKKSGRKTEVATTAETIVPIPPVDQSHHQDIGLESTGEIENIGLRSEVEEAKAVCKPESEGEGEGSDLGNLLRAWDRASQGALEKFKARVGLVAAERPAETATDDGLGIPAFLRRTTP
jgi:hypothetical protein